MMEAELVELMNTTVTVKSRLSFNADGEPTFSTGRTIRAYVQYGALMLGRTAVGESNSIRATIYTDDTAVTQNDQITLGGTIYNVFSMNIYTDEFGAKYGSVIQVS